MTYPATIVSTKETEYSRDVDYCQDGTLVFVMTNASLAIEIYYSKDAGQTWTLASTTIPKWVGSTYTVQIQGIFVDKDDHLHILAMDGSSGGTYLWLHCFGVPNAGRTNWTFTRTQLTNVSGGAYNYYPGAITAYREGTGWRAHMLVSFYDGGGSATYVYLFRVDISSSEVPSVWGSDNLWTVSGSVYPTGLDFRHTQADPKAVQASTPSLYITVTGNGYTSLSFWKVNYSGGTWTVGTRRTIYAPTGGTGAISSCCYDGTRVVMVGTDSSTSTEVLRVFERDEADTTTTDRTDPAALTARRAPGTLTYDCATGDILLHFPAGGDPPSDIWSTRYSRSGSAWSSWAKTFDLSGDTDWARTWIGNQPSGVSVGGYVAVSDAPTLGTYFVAVTQSQDIEANLQGVASITTAQVNERFGIDAALQGVAAISPDMQLRASAEVLMQGVARIATSELEGVPFHDFTVYDCYLESSIRSEGLLFFDEQKPETVSRKLTPTRQDVGNNPDEIRPEFGDMFAQGDFSHGAGQRYFHQAGRDPKKYWYSEGFDISEPGKLTHLRAIAEARDSTTIGRVVQVGDLPFVINGQRVDRGNGSWPGVWTAEDPSAADADQTVNDICAEGARLYAALNVSPASVRIRDSGGVWTHFQVTGVDLVVGTATRLAWLKERLMVVGGTSSRSIYEVAATATPTAIETLPEGWAFVDLFEAEGFIHATAVNTGAGLSRVHHYGLNSTFSAIEKKSSTPFPQGQLMYAGCGFPGLAFVGGGIRNSAGGYDPILYRAAVAPELGSMTYEEIRQEEGAGAADLSVRSVIPMGETILTSWSLGSGAYGGARDGIAIYHIGRGASARHLRKTLTGGAQRVGSIMPYQGRILISITGDGLYYEDLATYMTTAELVTSMADWNNAGLKVWDQIEISHDALAANHSFAVAYTTESFETATWNTVFTSSLDGSTREDGRLSNVKARQFALRITSTATASASPVFLGYNVRSLPSPVAPEFQLTRYIRLLGKDRKDEDAPFVFNDPDDMLTFLQDSIYQFVNFYESNASWIAWLEDVSTVEPDQPFYDLTHGEALKDAFVVRLQMTGTR